jgi:hypothetical protein
VGYFDDEYDEEEGSNFGEEELDEDAPEEDEETLQELETDENGYPVHRRSYPDEEDEL